MKVPELPGPELPRKERGPDSPDDLEGIIALTEALVRCRTTEERPDELWRAFHLVKLWWDEALPRGEAAATLTSWGREGETRPLVLVHPPGDPTPGILLHAHLDVAAAPDRLFTPEREGDRLLCRGAADMKGAAAVMLHLAAELLPRGPDFGLLLTFNEEVGGRAATGFGTEAFLKDLAGYRPAFFLTGERSSLRVASRSKGVLRLIVRQEGKAAHAATPWKGENAIEMLLAGLARADLSAGPAGASTAVVTFLRAGSPEAFGTVPGLAVAGIDARLVTASEGRRWQASVREALPDAEIEILLDEPPADCPPDDPILARLLAALEACGEPAKLYTKPHASDVRIANGFGIPGVVFGPDGGGVHADEEWVSLSSLGRYRRVLSRFLRMFLTSDDRNRS